jgi:signal transduction histidine kinase
MECQGAVSRQRPAPSPVAALGGGPETLERLALIAHDARTPLTTIKLAARVLRLRLAQLGARSDDLDEPLRGIEEAAVRLAALMNDLLDAGRLEAGQPLPLDCHPTDLTALARSIAVAHQQMTDQHRIEVTTDGSDLIGKWDALRLTRVVSNLLDNAIKYSPRGGLVRIRLMREPPGERVDHDDGAVWPSHWAVLSVEDNGIGIPAADLPHTFERFHRAANVADRFPGTGLGLAGARQIVEQHGGTIAVTSEEGKGTTVTVRLPLL